MKTHPNQLPNTFQAVFKSLPIPSYIWQNIDNDFDLVDANELAINDFSYKKNGCIGVKASEFYSNVSSIIDDLQKCIATKSSFERIVLIHFDDNPTILFSLHQFTFIDEITVLVQIKEIKNEQPLFFDSYEHDQLLASFIELNPAAIAMLDNDLRYIAASNKWISRFKLENINLQGKKHYDLFPEISDDWRKIHSRCLQGATEKRDEDAQIKRNWRHYDFF
jgi:PAS domain-containing protein